jgi:glycosyltransferase involved in cell wall biosynthesis
MKITFINAPVGTISGSQESVIFYMAASLSNNHEVTLITGRSRNRPLLLRTRKSSFKVVTVPFWSRESPFSRISFKIYKGFHPLKLESMTLYLGVLLRARIKRIIKESDVIVTYYRLDSLFFSRFAHKYGVPCVTNFQFSAFGKKFFDKDKSVMYLANSQFSKESLESKNDVKIQGVITPGVSLDFFNEKVPKVQEIPPKNSLLFVGNLLEHKGIFELLDIFSQVSRKNEDARLFIIGTGEMKPQMMKKVRELNMSENVKFVGEVSFEDMPSYYRSATMLVHPSHEETFGMVVLEAMACGLPVIATNLPSLKEVTGGSAILLPLDNKEEWVNKIEYLLNDPKTRQEMSVKEIEKAREHLWEHKAQQLEKYLLKAVDYKGKI